MLLDNVSNNHAVSWPTSTPASTRTHPHSTRSIGWFAFFCLALAVFLSLWRGQDANWDLLNYHYYNPYAWMNNRVAIDIAPAQLQSFHSPFADLPYYHIVRAGLPSWLGSSILGLPTAVALFFLGLIFRQLVPPASHTQQPIYLIAVVVLGATGAAGGPLVGTTMSEWHLVALFLAAIWLILRSNLPELDSTDRNEKRRNVFAWITLAGLLGGLAVGLKLTASTYAIGLAVLVFMLPKQLWLRLQCVVCLGIGGLAGALIAYGPWGYELWHRFGNPFFPYFNDIFQSPWAEPVRFADTRFVADSAWKFFTTPWLIMKATVGFITEMPFREWRMGLGIPAFVWLAWKTPELNVRRLWRALLLMFLTTYSAWAIFFGYYRYASLLELLSVMAVVALVANWAAHVSSPFKKYAILLLTVLLLMRTTIWPSWGRVPHGEMAVIATVPSMPNDSIVIIASLEPISYVIPSFPAHIPVISIVNNFMRPADGMVPRLYGLDQLAIQRVKAYQGHMFALVSMMNQKERYYSGVLIAEMIAPVGLTIDFKACRPIVSSIKNNALALCNVNRLWLPSASGL